jgi:multidrug efflux pump subunit AcrA (membrane-fusion protein)
MLFLVFLLNLIFSWLIRYPDTIPAQVEITTMNPPVTLVTKITGRIKNLFVTDREQVKAGQLLAVMETSASINDIQILKRNDRHIQKPYLVSNRDFYNFSELGKYRNIMQHF